MQTVDELFKLMQLFVKTYPDSSDQELTDIRIFRRQTLQLYIQVKPCVNFTINYSEFLRKICILRMFYCARFLTQDQGGGH